MVSPVPRAMVVVPCYNEAQRLDMAAFRAFADDAPDIALLFVNDGSRDETLPLLETLCADVPHFRLLDLGLNQGKAEAVRRGLQEALESETSIVGYWDADLAAPLDELPGMLAVFERRPEVDVVAGIRLPIAGRMIERPPLRRFLGRGFACCAQAALGLAMFDTQCGAKLLRAGHRLACVLATPFHSRWIFDVELLARWRRALEDEGRELHEHLYEYPLERWRDVPGSHLRAGDFVRAIGELAAIYRRETWRGGRRASQLTTAPASNLEPATLPFERPDETPRRIAPRRAA